MRGPDDSGDELTGMIREIRETVRSRHPSGAVGDRGVRTADLMPLVHARDVAQAKVAAIGTVNPRPPGLLNSLTQAFKRWIARVLDWHVREQVEFNRATVDSINSAIEALRQTNQALSELAGLQTDMRGTLDTLGREAADLKEVTRGALEQQDDIRAHWQEWRKGWEEKLATNEIQFLRSVADLQTAFQHRVTQIESNFRDLVRSQHADFTTALEKSGFDIQQRLWEDLERIRIEYERLIHNELRVTRQRMLAQRPTARPQSPDTGSAGDVAPIDFLRFADRFRGDEEHVKKGLAFYVGKFQSCREVLDLGCGRGEFLELMREAGIAARGIDLSEECVAICRSKGLDATQADLFEYLDSADGGDVDGIFCGQVVEHLASARLPEFARLVASRLPRGGLLAVETPNPECLAIFATHFYVDPTHTRPVPPSLMVFYLEEAGFGGIEVHQLSPAVETLPAVTELPEEFRKTFFGGLDYAVLARKL